jgi:hypothetical protein
MVWAALGILLVISVPRAALAEYKVIDVENGGTIKGIATWQGEIPKVPPLKVLADMGVCGETVESQALEIDPSTKGLRFVLVYLDKVEKGKAPASQYWVHMGRGNRERPGRACLFQEHVFPFVRTQDVAVVNSDEILHNPHFYDDKRASLLNVAMPVPNREVRKKLLRAHGVGLRLVCDVHVHMNAWMAAFDHPYFAVTDEQGRFEITGVPAGSYTLVAWHEGYNVTTFVSSRPVYDEPHVRKTSVLVQPGETLDVLFEFPVRQVTVEWNIAGESGGGSSN